MSEASTTIHDLPADVLTKSSNFRSTIFRNIIASFARVAAVSVVALVLPAFLIRHLPVQVYAAWVLIIQLGAYVSYLDLGIQANTKFVAEYDARGQSSCGRSPRQCWFCSHVRGWSTGLGTHGSARVASSNPVREHASKPLIREVRISLMFVGSSLCFGLVCAVYRPSFSDCSVTGFQRHHDC